MFVPNLTVKRSFIYRIPKLKSTIGIPQIHSSVLSSFDYVSLPIGSIHERDYLFYEEFHVNQMASLCSFKNIACSIIFGDKDIFGPCIRLWDSNNNKYYKMAMYNTGFFSSPIRVFVNLNTCPHLLDINETKKMSYLCWNENLSVTNNKSKKIFLFAGMMFVVSFIQKNSKIYFQLADNPTPKTWRQEIFSGLVWNSGK